MAARRAQSHVAPQPNTQVSELSQCMLCPASHWWYPSRSPMMEAVSQNSVLMEPQACPVAAGCQRLHAAGHTPTRRRAGRCGSR